MPRPTKQPYRRGVHDVVHKVTAVGSRGIESASAFVNELIDADHAPVKAYGSYAEVYSDPVCRILSDLSPPQPMTAFQDVDAIYIGLLQLTQKCSPVLTPPPRQPRTTHYTTVLGTPHTLHYPNAADAIKAGKHVLVEKPATTNAEEFRSLVALAKVHGVFLMEAMWTRFLPIAVAIKEIIDKGDLGAPVMVHADLSSDFDIESGSSVEAHIPNFVSILKLAVTYRHPANTPNSRPRAWRRRHFGLVSQNFQCHWWWLLIIKAQGPLPPCLGKIVLSEHRTLTISADRCRPPLPSMNIRLMTASSNPRSPRPW